MSYGTCNACGSDYCEGYDACTIRSLRAEVARLKADHDFEYQACEVARAEAERLREALRDMVTLVEQVEAFPTIVAQHNGLTNEGLKQLDQARAILYEKDK